MIDLDTFVADRNEALLSLSEDKIKSFIRKYLLPMPHSDDAFWLGVHIARCQIQGLPLEARIESYEWLSRRGHKVNVRLEDGGGTPDPARPFMNSFMN